jgi:hypothetical protein
MPITLKDIESEVTGGLENEKARLGCAQKNADFFRGRFKAYHVRPPADSNWEPSRFGRHSRIMGWLVETLAGDLYAHGPARTVADNPAATAWLNGVYKASGIDAMLQSADEWSAVGDVAGIQVVATPDPLRPVRHVLWPAHQLVVWESPDDPLTPIAVATLDMFDNQRRLRLWTPETRSTFATKKLGAGQTAGGTAYELIERVPNPYGILPFSFVHYHYPTTEFWSGGPGESFQETNDYINYALTEVGDSLRFCSKPIAVAKNVRPGWRPRTPVRPGDIWDLPAEGVDMDGNGAEPSLDPFQFDLGFVEAHWSDIESYLDHSMQCADVPPSSFRMVQSSGRSGLSIVAERMPLIARAQRRQRPAGYYELDLARVTLHVGGRHLNANAEQLAHEGLRVSAGLLAEAAANPDLTLRWPSMKPKLEGQEASAEDDARLKNRMKSRTQILIERDDMTREEAEAYIEQTAKDLAREQELLGAATVATPPAAGQPAAAPPRRRPRPRSWRPTPNPKRPRPMADETPSDPQTLIDSLTRQVTELTGRLSAAEGERDGFRSRSSGATSTGRPSRRPP